MIYFHPLQLPSLPQCDATELGQFSQKIESFSPTLPPQILLGKTPLPRHMDEILADIEGDRTVTPLEWVYCLQTKAQWDRQHPNARLSTAAAIWRSAEANRELKCLLEWRLRLYRQGFKEAIAPSLVKVETMRLEERSKFKE